MPALMVVASLKATSGIEEDASQNGFCFQTMPGDDADQGALNACAALTTFYTTVGTLMSPTVTRVANQHTFTVYDITAEVETPGVGWGSPIYDEPFDIPAPVTNFGLPAEVAVCLSFHAELTNAPVEVGATRPRSRRHGRVYLGPLCTAVAFEEPTAGAATRPRATYRGTITTAATALRGNLGINWSVWSRADDVVRSVIGGWVDDAFDVQRRRGVKPTLKSIF